MENFGFLDSASAVKNPFFSQNSYHFVSTGFGSYLGGEVAGVLFWHQWVL